MAKVKELPEGLVIEEDMRFEGWIGYDKKPGKLYGSVASIWPLNLDCGKVVTIDHLINCLKVAKECLGTKYQNIHVQTGIEEEEDEFGHKRERAVLRIMGRRRETAKEARERWAEHLKSAERERVKWENLGRFYKSEPGRTLLKEIALLG